MELSDQERAFIFAAFDAAPSAERFFEWNAVAATSGLEAGAMGQMVATLSQRGWIAQVKDFKAKLSSQAIDFVIAERASDPLIEIADSRERHLLVQLREYDLRKNRAGFDFVHVGYKCGMSQGDSLRFLMKLAQGTYVIWKTGSTVGLTDKGRKLAGPLYDDIVSSQLPQPDSLTKRFGNHESRGDDFLAWAWKQNYGDLKKPVDAREYARQHRLNRYEMLAIVDWLGGQELVRIDPRHEHINLHAKQYWDVPVNTHFAHAYLVFLEPEGVARGGEVAKERKLLSRIVAVLTHGPKHAETWVRLVLFLLGVAGWGLYIKGCGNDAVAPHTAASQPATRPP